MLFQSTKKGKNFFPIDTTVWAPTDTIFGDLNNDNLIDLVIEFDKYKSLTRPNNIQTPLLIFLGEKNGKHNYLTKAEHSIIYPDFKITINNNVLIIKQIGAGTDKHIYFNFYKFQNDGVVLFREIIEQKIEKLKIDIKTGDIKTIVERIDTIHDIKKNIPIDIFNFKSRNIE